MEKPTVINPSWGTKRNCPSCSAHFYDLNKMPAVCPKCSHSFDPTAIAKAKRKTVKREAPEAKKEAVTATILAKKQTKLKKDRKEEGDGDEAGGIDDIAEIEDVEDIESLQELSELEEREEKPLNEDDADEEAIIEELNTGDKAIVGNIEEEEANALSDDIEEEEEAPVRKKAKAKKK